MITKPTEFWWVQYWGLRKIPNDDLRPWSDKTAYEIREQAGAKPGVVGPFWDRYEAESYAATLPAKTALVRTPVGVNQRPPRRTK